MNLELLFQLKSNIDNTELSCNGLLSSLGQLGVFNFKGEDILTQNKNGILNIIVLKNGNLVIFYNTINLDKGNGTTGVIAYKISGFDYECGNNCNISFDNENKNVFYINGKKIEVVFGQDESGNLVVEKIIIPLFNDMDK